MGVPRLRQYVILQDLALEDPHSILIQRGSSPTNQRVMQFKESKVTFSKKFDIMHLKFQRFVNQVQLVIFLQPQHYPTNESQVGLLRTLLTRQALCWFSPLFEKKLQIQNNFKMFLATFDKAFKEHNKIHLATTKFVFRGKEHALHVHTNQNLDS